VLGGHERSVYSISWGRGKGKAGEDEEYLGWLASVGGDGVIRVWEVVEKKGKAEAQLITEERNSHGVREVNAVSFCGREGFERVMATAGDDGIVRVWEILV
jgi:cytosolic iron-sulfur protein assembly protein CIAO1